MGQPENPFSEFDDMMQQHRENARTDKLLNIRAKSESRFRAIKIITKSPWGDFVTLYIHGQKYERSAQGGFWTREKGTAPFPDSLKDLLVMILPVWEMKPDIYSPMLQNTVPGVYTDMWSDGKRRK